MTSSSAPRRGRYGCPGVNTRSQIMQPPSTRLLLTIPFAVPAYWTPEQALAVVELLDDLRELIWAHYQMQLIDELRDGQSPSSSDQSDAPDKDPRF
jgi:hypothetical protein